jgi:hypothetical protein
MHGAMTDSDLAYLLAAIMLTSAIVFAGMFSAIDRWLMERRRVALRRRTF